MKPIVFCLVFLSWLMPEVSSGQSSITEEIRTLRTYAFSDPDPIPILVSNPKIYPYYKYEGYRHEPEMKNWKIVKLENDYIEVYVLPEVGGKVWGAIDKTTGNEFIYRNEVMKFRNISMRGPWTSGGIEFNFGIIGHHPSTATPVDYITQQHDDGTVSCTVGNIDLTSRTQWRVQISLHPDEAFFRTNATWFNPTDLHQSYYNWMTAAAFAQEDLVFYTPGDTYLRHSGEAVAWPKDIQGRNLSRYAENNFGPSKSYHVVGEYNDFFGGYFEKEDYGFGHLSAYEEMPGQKLWLWALSRSGGIWEDLLTDTDGQYIEFQAGRLFVQYSPGDHDNPITQATFEPMMTDTWEECWFPVNKIGGITDASEYGVLHLSHAGNQLEIGIMALQKRQGQLQVTVAGKEILNETISLKPLGVWSKSLSVNSTEKIQVKLNELDLNFNNDSNLLKLKRPFESPEGMDLKSLEHAYRSAMEDVKFREYNKAMVKFDQILEEEPFHLEALIGMGDLRYRSGEASIGLALALKALSLDTYHAGANFLAGNLHLDLGDPINALECYGLAARSMTYRSAAYAKMAEIYVKQYEWELASRYAQKSLDYNTYNISAMQTQILIAKMNQNNSTTTDVINRLLTVDPINHFALYESGSLEPGYYHRSEDQLQTYLELALIYYRYGMNDRALDILSDAPATWLTSLWKDYLDNQQFDKLSEIEKMSTGTIFPYRKETLELLGAVSEISDHWKFAYWYGLALQGKGRTTEAELQFQKCGNDPDDPFFYVTRANLFDDQKEADLKKAYDLNSQNWKTGHELITYYLSENQPESSLSISRSNLARHNGNFVVEMDHIKVLYALHNYSEADKILETIKVLPFEGASGGRAMYASIKRNLALQAYEQQNIDLAIKYIDQARQWPENLGVGKPFDPDERIEDYLMGMIYKRQGSLEKEKAFFKRVVIKTELMMDRPTINNLLGLKLMSLNGEQEKAFLLLSMTKHLQDKHPQYVKRMYEMMNNRQLSYEQIIDKIIKS